jgi:hypothetical protein
MFFDPELFSAESASAIPITWRATSISVYWNPPQVARNGQFCSRANWIPRSIPSMLWYGLPGEAHRPSKPASTSFALTLVKEGVGNHSDSTFLPSFVAACWSESLVA